MGAAKKKTAVTFTSGPWEIWGPCNEDSPMQKPCMVVQSTSADVQVTECVWDHGDGEAKEAAIADARLIAQAPEMFRLLRDAQALIGSNDSQREAALKDLADGIRTTLDKVWGAS